MAVSRRLSNRPGSNTIDISDIEQLNQNFANEGTSESLQDLASGIPYAQQLAQSLGLTDLGRLSEERSAAAADTMKKATSLSEGLSSAEMAAMKSQGLEAIGNQSKAAQRRLASMQAAQGVRGGAAVAQNMSLQGQGIQARGNLERDILMNQFNSKMQGTALLSNVQQADDATKREAQQFNIAQSAKEKAIPLAISVGAQSADIAKYAADKGADAVIQSGNARASGGGGGGFWGTVICTELHRQGIFDDETLALDDLFGRSQPEDVMKGYHFLAIPVVKLMQKSELITNIVAFFAVPWSQHMTHIINDSYEDDLFGRILMNLGKSSCKLIGKLLIKLGK